MTKIAMITGASIGIGRAVAMLMAEQNIKLVLLDMDGEKLTHLAAQLQKKTELITFTCDISDEAAVRSCVHKAQTEFGGIDTLVNCAALWRAWNDFADQDMDTWRRFFDVNVTGAAVVTQAVLPGMLERQWGRIIHVASVAGVYGNKRMACYSATKGAVISFVKALAKEVADKGVTVNAVSPGSVSDSANSDMDFVKQTELCHMGRTGSGRENAELICFLASDAASYITGQNIQIDGCRKRI